MSLSNRLIQCTKHIEQSYKVTTVTQPSKIPSLPLPLTFPPPPNARPTSSYITPRLSFIIAFPSPHRQKISLIGLLIVCACGYWPITIFIPLGSYNHLRALAPATYLQEHFSFTIIFRYVLYLLRIPSKSFLHLPHIVPVLPSYLKIIQPL